MNRVLIFLTVLAWPAYTAEVPIWTCGEEALDWCNLYCQELGCHTASPLDANACDLALQAWSARVPDQLPACLEAP